MQPHFLPLLVAVLIGVVIYAISYGLFVLNKSVPMSLGWIVIVVAGGRYLPLYEIFFGFWAMLLVGAIGTCFMGDSVEGNNWKFFWAFASLLPMQVLSMEAGLFVGRHWILTDSVDSNLYLITLAVSAVVPAVPVWCWRVFRGIVSSTLLSP